MSHGRARALLTAVLDALTAFRYTATGERLGKALLTVPAIPVDTADVTAAVQAVEAEATATLGDGGRAGTSSATASTRSESPVAPVAPIAVAAAPMAIDPSLSLVANVGRLVAASLRRQLLTTEMAAIDDALDTASGVLQEGDETTRRALLHSNMLTALINPGAAYLWASCVERSEGGVESVEAFATAVIASCSDVASVLFASDVRLLSHWLTARGPARLTALCPSSLAIEETLDVHDGDATHIRNCNARRYSHVGLHVERFLCTPHCRQLRRSTHPASRRTTWHRKENNVDRSRICRIYPERHVQREMHNGGR